MHSSPSNPYRQDLLRIIQASDWFMSALRAVRSLQLSSWCIGAGALRNLVWDHLHGYQQASNLADIDVAHFDARPFSAQQDAEIEAQLRLLEPELPWEVTNQAWVHTWFESHFGHPVAPLASIEDAVSTWPEYATSVGVCLHADGGIEVIAPHGLQDLLELRIRRNPSRVSVETYRQRIEQKQYARRWPLVTIVHC